MARSVLGADNRNRDIQGELAGWARRTAKGHLIPRRVPAAKSQPFMLKTKGYLKINSRNNKTGNFSEIKVRLLNPGGFSVSYWFYAIMLFPLIGRSV
jgi:hypothetical protein